MPSARRALMLTAAILVVAAATVPAVDAAGRPDAGRHGFACTDGTLRERQIAPFLGTTGLYEVPKHRPPALIVFAHGYQASSAQWTDHLAQAYQHGYASVAMDYHGTNFQTNDVWKVSEGAQDMIAAARFFLARCRSIRTVVMFGVSMGGNASGLAVAADATRASGKPLFDYWFDIEGVANLLEEYLGARALAAATGKKLAVGAVTAIQDECGGPPEEGAAQAACYQRLTLTTRPQDIKASGVRSVIMVHAVEDGEVPADQTKQLSSELRALGVTTDVYNVLRRNAGEKDSEQSLLAYASPPFDDPFAGHTGESTSTTAVMGTSLGLLWALLAGSYEPITEEHLVDNQSVGIQPPPNASK